LGFFRSKYDLYSEIVSDPNGFEGKIIKICKAIGKRDMEQDMVDAVRDVDNSYGFSNAIDPLKFLLVSFSNLCDKGMEI
jgi:hypothetical protein